VRIQQLEQHQKRSRPTVEQRRAKHAGRDNELAYQRKC